MTSADVEIALVGYAGSLFSPRRYIAVPNVSHGWGLDYEADLIAVTPGGRCDEVEIKISRADLVADQRKQKWRRGLDGRISRFWYAVPEELVGAAMALPHTPDGIIHGVVAVQSRYDRQGYYQPPHRIIREPQRRPGRCSPEDRVALLRLGYVRFWDVKTTLRDRVKDLDDMRARMNEMAKKIDGARNLSTAEPARVPLDQQQEVRDG